MEHDPLPPLLESALETLNITKVELRDRLQERGVYVSAQSIGAWFSGGRPVDAVRRHVAEALELDLDVFLRACAKVPPGGGL